MNRLKDTIEYAIFGWFYESFVDKYDVECLQISYNNTIISALRKINESA